MAHVLVKDLREAAIKFILEGKLTESSQITNLKCVSEDGYFNNYLIPETWEIVSLNECCYIHARIGWQALTKSEHQKQGDYLLITGTDFKNGFVDYSNCVYVSKERYDMDSKIQLQNDDILITKDGTLGKVAVVKDLPKPATLNSGVFVIRPDERFEKKYIEYLFQGSYFSKFVDSVKYGTTIKHLNQNKLVNFLIPVPSKGEQKSIVAKIDELMAKIDEYEKLENELVELKKNFPGDMKAAVLQAAMQGKLTDIYDYVECEYGDMFEISGGSQPSKNAFIDTPKEGYIQLYQTRDYGEKPQPVYIPIKYATKLTKKGDILLARYGGSLGKVFWAKDGAYNVAMAKVIFNKPELHDPRFVYYYHLSPIYQGFCSSIANGRSAQAGFNKDDIGSLPYPLFTIEEQRRIVEKLDKILPLCEELDKVIA